MILYVRKSYSVCMYGLCANLTAKPKLFVNVVVTYVQVHCMGTSWLYSYYLVWADNADNLSIQYAGTKALKTDFTRTGKRTRFGALQDGVNSSFRYICNNFTDGFRQVCLYVCLFVCAFACVSVCVYA